jgi:hypothetical protein
MFKHFLSQNTNVNTTLTPLLPTHAHETYKLLTYKIHKNVILKLRRVPVYVITLSSGGYQMRSLLRLLRYV